jgi:phosphoenolpyruvate carboxylase
MRHGLSYFQQTIMDMVPIFYRRVDTALANIGLPRMPLTHRLFEFGSWMGGDRDGNPNVTAGTTRDVVVLARCGAVVVRFDSALCVCCGSLAQLLLHEWQYHYAQCRQ